MDHFNGFLPAGTGQHFSISPVGKRADVSNFAFLFVFDTTSSALDYDSGNAVSPTFKK